jgi:hypothetical protein
MKRKAKRWCVWARFQWPAPNTWVLICTFENPNRSYSARELATGFVVERKLVPNLALSSSSSGLQIMPGWKRDSFRILPEGQRPKARRKK